MVRDLLHVTSFSNQHVKDIKALEMKKRRVESGSFVIEGVKFIAHARDAGWQMESLLVEENSIEKPLEREMIAWALSMGADCLKVPRAILAKLSARDNPQSALAVLKERWAEAPTAPQKSEVWIALEEVRDAGNLGTILRTADSVGAQGVILIGECVDVFGREAVRATMGSLFAVPVARMTREAFLAFRQGWKGSVVGTHLSGTHDYRRAYEGPVLLVMGSEGPGLSETLAAACSDLVKIPMAGSADSLNLAIATALMLYEIKRPVLKLS